MDIFSEYYNGKHELGDRVIKPNGGKETKYTHSYITIHVQRKKANYNTDLQKDVDIMSIIYKSFYMYTFSRVWCLHIESKVFHLCDTGVVRIERSSGLRTKVSNGGKGGCRR